MYRGAWRCPDETAISSPFSAPIDRCLSLVRLAGAVPRSAAVRRFARTDRCPYRDRRCAVFGRHSVSHLDEAAVPERDLARFRRPCGGLSLRGDLANRLAGGRQTLICLCLARRPE